MMRKIQRHLQYKDFYPAKVGWPRWQDAEAGWSSCVWRDAEQPTGLADLLLWFGLVDDGIVLQRDGSLLAAWQYRGLIFSPHSCGDGGDCTADEPDSAAWKWMDDSGGFLPLVLQRLFPGRRFPDAVTALIDRNGGSSLLLRAVTLKTNTFWP